MDYHQNTPRTPIVSLAEKDKRMKEDEKKKRADARAEMGRNYVPLLALVLANVIFISLDVRAWEAVYILTNNIFLASVTVLVSGIIALLWWDIFYPHSRRHSNDTQIKIAFVSTVLAVFSNLGKTSQDESACRLQEHEASLEKSQEWHHAQPRADTWDW